MKVLNGVEHYNSFGELREVFGLKPVQRTNKEKLNNEREVFDKKFICKVCGAPLVFEQGTNVMVCQNPKCKGIKKTNYDANGNKIVEHFPVTVLLNKRATNRANSLYKG